MTDENSDEVLNLFSSDLDCIKLLDSLLEKENNINKKYEPRGFTLLHYAALVGKVNIIPLLIERGCTLNMKSKDGSTALHVATKNRNSEFVEILTKKGVKSTILDNNGKSPLAIAIENDDIDTFKILLKLRRSSIIRSKGIPTKASDSHFLVYLATSVGNSTMVELLLAAGATANSYSPKPEKSALSLAIENANLEITNVLLQHNPNVNNVNEEGFTLLHLACISGNISIICALLNTGKCTLDAKSEESLTALHLAAKAGHSQVVTLLLEKGADYKLSDRNNKTPLIFALESTQGDVKTLEILLNHIRRAENCENSDFSLIPESRMLLNYHIEARTRKNGSSALHVAIENGDIAVIDMLLKMKACIDIEDENNLTPMLIAVDRENTDVLELFFKAGISPNVPNRIGLAPLHIAARKNNKNLIMLLLKNGANVDDPGRNYSETPLFIAAEEGNMDTLEILSEASTTRSSEWKEGYCLLYIAAYRGHENLVKMLLNKRVDPNANLDEYLTPLHAAAQRGHVNIVHLLLEHGAKVNPKREADRSETTFISTPLLAAFHAGHTEIIQLLLSNGADVNARIKYVNQDSVTEREKILIQGSYTDFEVKNKKLIVGCTPLHFAVEAEAEDIIQLLLKRGAIVNFCSNCAARPIGLAVEKGNETIIKYLLFAGANVFLTHKHTQILKMESLKKNVNIAKTIINYVSTSQSNTSGGNVTPLGLAVENELEEYVQMLLKTPVDANIEHKGEHVLLIAVKKQNSTIVRMLLKHGVDEEIGTALLSAVKLDDSSIIELILDRESCLKKHTPFVDIFLKMEERQYIYNESPFYLALRRSNWQVVDKFLKYGATVDMTDKTGKSPIFYAVQWNNLEVVEFLAKKGASLKIKTNAGENLLYFALKNQCCKEEIFDVLIKYGVEVHIQNTEGLSPLNIIVSRIKLIKAFLVNDLNPNQTDVSGGKTLLEIAILSGDPDIVRMLILRGANIDYLNTKGEISLKIAIERASMLARRHEAEHRVFTQQKISNDLDNIVYEQCCINLHQGILKNLEVLQTRKIVRLLIQEVARQEVISDNINVEHLELINSQYVKQYYERCKTEIEFMKVTDICPGISYFQILAAKNSTLVSWSRNNNIIGILFEESEVIQLFPEYAAILRGRIRIGRERRILLDSSHPLLKKVLSYNWPFIIVEYIFSFLSNNDLRNLNNACRNDMFFE